MTRLTWSERFGVLRELVPEKVSNSVVIGVFQEITGLSWPQTVAAVREYQDRRRTDHAVHTPGPAPDDSPPLVVTGQGDFTRGWTPAV